MAYLIAGLGNIGPQYELTRHNIGFLVLDRLADLHKAPPFTLGRYGFVTSFSVKGKKVTLLKPNTYMNLSGKAVRYWLQEQKLTPNNLLVVTDDIALPFGKIRLKPKGSSGGHNGLENINLLLETTEYARLRWGVDNKFAKGRQADYVLSPFNKEEMNELLAKIDNACEAIVSYCSVGLELTMTQFNK